MNQNAASSDYINRPAAEDSVDDVVLLGRVAEGDQTAFSELYQRHHVGLYNYLLRLIHQESVAEELLQEVFVAVWEGAADFRQQASVKTWIFRIGHHKAVSWLRKLKRYDDLVSQYQPRAQVSVEGQASETWRADVVREALDQLSAPHRAVVELAYVHELSYAEIAQILDCPVGTVKSRMSYALKHLDGLLRRKGME
ncbi:MAG: RNA polymerase sigma factor [Candidatus Promineifilaceae bacterium]|nr:RNA polymerase sigma factor [Candidatus Promineifilaceae bacterium]